tara:strand:- start:30 stop:287 length:258 start_codon:yes stop_codon:yes gene_type:complete
MTDDTRGPGLNTEIAEEDLRITLRLVEVLREIDPRMQAQQIDFLLRLYIVSAERKNLCDMPDGAVLMSDLRKMTGLSQASMSVVE